MKQTLKLLTATTLSISLLAGCAQMNNNTKDTLAGAGIGAVAGGVLGKVVGGSQGARIGAVLGAGAGAWLGHEYALKKARELAKDAEVSGLHPTLTTKQEQLPNGKTQEAIDKFVLPLDAADVHAHGAGTTKLLVKAASIANGNQSDQKITVHLYGSTQDLSWMSSVVASQLSDKNAIQVHQAATPRLELSPVPTIATATKQ